MYFWDQHCYQGNDQIYRPKSCLVPLCTSSLWPLTGLISPTWGNHLSAVSRDKFTFSRVLNKWNLRVCILFGLVSFTLHHYFNIYPCHCSDSSILLLHTLWLYGYNTFCSSSNLLMIFHHVSSLECWQINYCEHLGTSLCMDIGFHFSLGEFRNGSYVTCIFGFIRNCQIVFQTDFTNLHSHQDVRVLVSLPPCQHLASLVSFIVCFVLFTSYPF